MSQNNRVQHQNQFFVCDSTFQPTPPVGFSHAEFTDELDVYHSETLPVFQASDGDNELAVIGDVVLPNGPTVRKWMRDTVNKSLKEVFRRSQALTGRYVILYSDGDSATVIPDALAHKSVYYHTDVRLVTTSLKLLFDSVDVEQRTNSEAVAFMNSAQFTNNESAFIGDKTLFRDLRCVLPNHILDMDAMEPSRRPLFSPDTQQSPVEFIADSISGAMESFNDKFHLLTPITAGWDSRTILACSKDIVRDVTWYTFSNWSSGEHPDVKIPKRMAAEQNFDYSIHHPRGLDDDFRSALSDYLCWTRNLSKTKHIQFLYNNYDVEKHIYVTGNGPIFKTNYPSPENGANLVDHCCEMLQYPNSEFVEREIEEWLPDVTEYAKENDISPMNLLYWEQRMGRWGALAPREKDIAIRGVSPFSNYNLLLTALSVDSARLSPPNYDLISGVIEEKWPELRRYTVNPSKNPLKAKIASTAPYPVERFLRYVNAKMN